MNTFPPALAHPCGDEIGGTVRRQWQLPRLTLDGEQRAKLWKKTIDSIDLYLSEVENYRVIADLSAGDIRTLIKSVDFNEPLRVTVLTLSIQSRIRLLRQSGCRRDDRVDSRQKLCEARIRA